MLISVAISAFAGLGAAGLFLRAQLSQTLQAPGAQYYVFVSGGVVASLFTIASTLAASVAHHRTGDRPQRVIRLSRVGYDADHTLWCAVRWG